MIKIDLNLNKTFCDLFQEYLNSNEFPEEIEYIKKGDKKCDNVYIKRYIEFSKNFIKN